MKISSFDTASTDPLPTPSSFAGVVAEARIHVEVTVPRTKIIGRMRILTRQERLTVRLEARAFLKSAGLDGPALEVTEEWRAELATRTIAVAMRSPDNINDTLATLEAWNQCDEGQLDFLWQRYQDLVAQVDPLDLESSTITAADVAVIADAAKKKQSTLLMSYGSPKLAAYAISMASELSS